MTEHPDEPLQNDPDRANGLVSDAVGEFVAQEPGGAFDPRTFREPGRTAADAGRDAEDRGPDEPPMDDERMVWPGEEIEKSR